VNRSPAAAAVAAGPLAAAVVAGPLAAAVAAGLLAATLPGAAAAHHSFAALFDLESFVEVEGRVTDIRWINPHIKFYVDSEGDAWEIEAGPTNLLTRMGIERELIEVGDTIRVRGNPGRRDPHTVWVMNVRLPDGTEVLANPEAAPFWGSRTVGESSSLFERGEAAPAAGAGDSIFKVWTTVIPSMPLPVGPPSLTERGRDAQAAFDAGDVPFPDCEPPGMPLAMGGPYPIELIDRGDRILIRMESYDQERVVHLAAPAREPAPSPLGYSLGRWEGDRELVVETTRIDYDRFGDLGPAQSGDGRVVERFTLSPDGLELAYQLTITDPVNLADAWSWSGSYFYREGETLKRWNCGVE